MSAVDNILSMIENLSAADKTALKIALSKTAHHNPRQLEEFVTSERFAKGRVCPHCGCVHVVRNGKRPDGIQKYLCRDCGKSFVITSNTIVSGTRKELSVWESYISCMMQGLSIRKTAEICGIYSIQHINNYHSRLKRFMMNFCGVSTKYLNNCLVWHNFVNYARETEVEKKSILLRFVLTEQKMVTCREISKRSALPVAG